jgi:hypothetical protein
VLEYASFEHESVKGRNRAHVSLEVFKDVVNSESLNVPFLLVLNKADLLPHLLQQCSFSSTFPHFSLNDRSCVDVINFMKDEYLAQYTGNEENKILPIVMNSLDTRMIRETLNIVISVVKQGSINGHEFKMWDPSSVDRILFTRENIQHLNFYDVVIIYS